MTGHTGLHQLVLRDWLTWQNVLQVRRASPGLSLVALVVASIETGAWRSLGVEGDCAVTVMTSRKGVWWASLS